MNKSEIDKMFMEFFYANYEYLWNLAEMDDDFSYEKAEVRGPEIFERIMKKIEKGNLKYFLFKIKDNKEIGAYLLSKSSNKNIIKEFIEKSREIGFQGYLVGELINGISDKEDLKKYVYNWKKIGLAKYLIPDIIERIGDIEFTEKCIKDRRKIGLNLDETISIISKIHVPEITQKYIESEKYNKHRQKIIDRTIQCITNSEIAKRYFENRKAFNFSTNEEIKLLCMIQAKSIIKKYIKSKSKEDITSSQVVKLIKSVGDIEFEKECIRKNKELSIASETVLSLINHINNTDFFKECINEAKNINLNSNEIVQLIIKSGDKNFIQKCLENNEKIGINQFGLKILTNLFNEDTNLEKQQRIIKLPNDIKFGIEIECIGCENKLLETVIKSKLPKWECKTDSSIKENIGEGIEIISPPLSKNHNNNTNQIKLIGKIFSIFEQYTNQSCGGHIHIDSRYLSNVQSWNNLLELYANIESILYVISNEEGEIPREDATWYASPVSKKWESYLNEESINFNDIEDLKTYKNKLILMQGGQRYKGINFLNLAPIGTGTIEFRIPNGSVNPNVWIENINLYGGIVKAAEDLCIIQNKPEIQRSAIENEKIKAFEKLKSMDLEENEKLEAFLKIIDIDNEVYKQRYETNRKLLKNHPKLKKAIQDRIANKVLKVQNKNNIGKGCFTGEKRVKGKEYKYTKEIIERDMQLGKNQQEFIQGEL